MLRTSQLLSQTRLYSQLRSLSSLIVGEQTADGIPNPSVLNSISAAAKLGGSIDVVLGGSGASTAASKLAGAKGVGKILVSEAEHLSHGVAEEWAPFLAQLVGARGYTHVLAAASSSGKSVLPRLAALLDVSPISEITAVRSADTFVRPFYAGNAMATVQSADKVKVVTLRPTSFDPAEVQASPSAAVEQVEAPAPSGLTKYLSQEVTKSERPDLATAKIVISGGRALKSAENFQLVYGLADKLGAAVGASRAAVDAGYCPNDMQVGQTGKIVAPQLYVAIGISGAIQHLAGMKDSKVIVAINKDPEAPIFQVADYGLVADLFDVIPEFSRLLDSK